VRRLTAPGRSLGAKKINNCTFFHLHRGPGNRLLEGTCGRLSKSACGCGEGAGSGWAASSPSFPTFLPAGACLAEGGLSKPRAAGVVGLRWRTLRRLWGEFPRSPLLSCVFHDSSDSRQPSKKAGADTRSTRRARVALRRSCPCSRRGQAPPAKTGGPARLPLPGATGPADRCSSPDQPPPP
jgi:hypothetical protein